MLKNNTLLDDMAKLAGGAAGSLLEMRKEIESLVQAKVDEVASNMNLVTREEFEVAREMASKARIENEALLAKLGELEAKLAEMEQK